MDMLHVILFSLLCLAVAGIVVVFRRDEKEFEIAIHKWAARFATILSKAGASKVITTPFHDLAAADDEGAIGTGETAVEYLEHPANWEKEFLSMLAVGLADPFLGPKVKKFFADVVAGAPQATIQADADDVLKSSPLSEIDQANKDLEDSVHHIFSEVHHPDLAGAFDKLPKGQKFLSKLLVAGKTAGANAVAAVSPPAAAALAAIPDGHILLGPNAVLPGLQPDATKPAAPATP